MRARLLAAVATVVVAVTLPAQRGRPVPVTDLEAFFAEVEEHYPFFAVKGIREDWQKRKPGLLQRAKVVKSDADFIVIARDALAGLRDGHATLTEVRPKLDRVAPEYWPGVALLPATEGRVVVAATGSELERKLPSGTIVEKIDGERARTFLDRRGDEAWQRGGFFSSPQRARFFAYRLALRGERGAKHELSVRRDGVKKVVKLRAAHQVGGWLHLYNPPEDLQQVARSVWHCELEGGVGYLWLRRMDETVEEGIAGAIEAHPAAKRWIVDLRGNTGGGYGRTLKQRIAKLGRRVAVILDAGAVSAAETFARDLVNVCGARTFGATTAGSSSSKKVWAFPSGVASVRYSVRSRTGVGGLPIEYRGIVPDVALEADPQDVTAGRNTEILAALAWLQR